MVAIFQEGNKSGIVFRISGWLVLDDASFFSEGGWREGIGDWFCGRGRAALSI